MAQKLSEGGSGTKRNRFDPNGPRGGEGGPDLNTDFHFGEPGPDAEQVPQPAPAPGSPQTSPKYAPMGDQTAPKFSRGGPVHLDDGGDPVDAPTESPPQSTPAAIDPSPPQSTQAAVADAVNTIDSALQYGRQKYGLPTDDQQGAVPDQSASIRMPQPRPPFPPQGPAPGFPNNPRVDTAAAAAPVQAPPAQTGFGTNDQNTYNPNTLSAPPQAQPQGAIRTADNSAAPRPIPPKPGTLPPPQPKPFNPRDFLPGGPGTTAGALPDDTQYAYEGGPILPPLDDQHAVDMNQVNADAAKRAIAAATKQSSGTRQYNRGGPVHLTDGGDPADQDLYASQSPAAPALNTEDQGAPSRSATDPAGAPFDVGPQQQQPPVITPGGPDASAAGPTTAGEAQGRQTAQQDPVMAYLSRKDKSSEELWNHYADAAKDKYPDANPAQLNTLTVHSMPNQDMQFGGTQYLASKSDEAAHTVRALINNPPGGTINHEQVAAGIEQMLSNTTTGESVKVKYAQDGLYKFEVTGGAGKTPAVFTVNINQLNDLSNIGKAGQADTLNETGIVGTLKELSQQPGTAPTVPTKPEEPEPLADKTTNTGTYMDRYTAGEKSAAQARYPWIGESGKKQDYMEALRQKRLEPAQELAKAQAGFESKKEIATLQGGVRTAGQDKRAASIALEEQGKNDRALASLNRLQLAGEEGNLVKQAGQYRAQGAAVPAALQQQLDGMTQRHADQMTGGAGTGAGQGVPGLAPPAQEDTSTAPAGGGQQPAAAPQRQPAAPLNRGLNPDGTPRLGKRPQAGWNPPQQRTQQ